MATQNSQGDRVKRCLELQDALQQLPPEIQHKMLPACRTIVLRRTSKTMQMAVEKADAVVQVRDGNPFFNAQGLVEKLNGLSMWCKVTVLRLKDCCVWRHGAGRLGEAIAASFLSASLVELDLEGNGIEDSGGRALAKTLRLNTTLTSLNLNANRLGEGSGRSLAETLRLNTTITSLYLSGNGLGEGGGRALAKAQRLA